MKSFLREMGIFLVLGVVTAGAVYLVRQNRTLTEQNELLARRAHAVVGIVRDDFGRARVEVHPLVRPIPTQQNDLVGAEQTPPR